MAVRLKPAVLTAIKLIALAFPVVLIIAQVPELRYDLGSRAPVAIEGPSQLQPGRFTRSTFVAVSGSPDLDEEVSAELHGQSWTCFTVKPYGRRLVVHTFEPVTPEWVNFDRLVGRLRPGASTPLARRMKRAFRDQLGVDIPEDAYFLSLYDVPARSGWQLGAVAYAVLLAGTMIYLFFFFRRRRGAGHATP